MRSLLLCPLIKCYSTVWYLLPLIALTLLPLSLPLLPAVFCPDPARSNSLAFTFFVPGIPIVYYGTEALKDVQREPLWEKWDYNSSAPFYINLKMLNW